MAAACDSFNDEIPKEEDFENTLADYLNFEFNRIMNGRIYLFENNELYDGYKIDKI